MVALIVLAAAAREAEELLADDVEVTTEAKQEAERRIARFRRAAQHMTP